MSKIRGVLFDKDGTLVDYYATWLPLNRLAASRVALGDEGLTEMLLKSAGWVPHPEEGNFPGTCIPGSPLVAGNCRDIAEVFWQHLPQNLIETHKNLDNVEKHIVDAFCEHLQANISPVCDLVEFCQDLKDKGFFVGVATNDSEEGAYNTLNPLGVSPLLDFICGYDSGYGTKPSAGMLEGFCAKTGLKPQEVAMVGDSFHDLEMGRAGGAGLLVGVLTGTASRQDLEEHAHVVLPSIVELKELLDELNELNETRNPEGSKSDELPPPGIKVY